MNMDMDKPYMENNIYYRAKIKSKLPQLHDCQYHSEKYFTWEKLFVPLDLEVDDVKRGLGLERVGKSLFHYQLKQHSLENSSKELYDSLNNI